MCSYRILFGIRLTLNLYMITGVLLLNKLSNVNESIIEMNARQGRSLPGPVRGRGAVRTQTPRRSRFLVYCCIYGRLGGKKKNNTLHLLIYINNRNKKH